MNFPTPSSLHFASLEEASAVLPGIIRTLPENCQPQVRVLTQALTATCLREVVASEPTPPPFDLSRFQSLRHSRVSTLSPADAQYMLRATVSYLLTDVILKCSRGEDASLDSGYAQTLLSLAVMWEISPEQLAAETIAAGEALSND
jgi:hypothetical protein